MTFKNNWAIFASADFYVDAFFLYEMISSFNKSTLIHLVLQLGQIYIYFNIWTNPLHFSIVAILLSMHHIVTGSQNNPH